MGDIDLKDITEPILCAPNDPDDARTLSDVAGEKIDEVFVGSCMTNIGHFRAVGELLKSFKGQLPTRLWVAPPTKAITVCMEQRVHVRRCLDALCAWVTRHGLL